MGPGRGLWVKRGTKRRDLGFWKGIVGKNGDKKEGFGVLEGDYGYWKGWILGMVSVSS